MSSAEEDRLREPLKVEAASFEEVLERILALEALIREIWHALDRTPAPHFISGGLRSTIVGAAHELPSPKPWEEPEAVKRREESRR